jgi:hypothetical protein
VSDRFALVVPRHKLRWYEEGEAALDVRDGDTILVRHTTEFARLISAGQKALTVTQPELRGFTWCDHTAKIRGSIHGWPAVSEMGPRGYERRSIRDYDDELLCRVRWLVSDESIKRACAYDFCFTGIDYGWLEYLPAIIDGVTDAKLVGSWGDATICSGHVTMCDMGLGLFPDRPPNAVIPAHIAMWVDARHVRPL